MNTNKALAAEYLIMLAFLVAFIACFLTLIGSLITLIGG